MTTDKARLIELLLDLSYQKRKVTLASGRESDFYIDGKQTTLHAEGASIIGRLVLEMIRQDPSINGVGGLSMGADPIATATAIASTQDGGAPIHSFYVRKEAKGHGTQEYVEGLKNFPERGRVVVVEDTSTTGGSASRNQGCSSSSRACFSSSRFTTGLYTQAIRLRSMPATATRSFATLSDPAITKSALGTK